MGKKSYESRASSSSSMFNGDVRVFECWCPRICVVRKANTLKNPKRPLYACPLSKVCLTIKHVMLSWFDQHLTDYEFSFVHDDVENCEFFVRVDEAEELGYFKNNGISDGHVRKTILMDKVQSMVKAKAKESGNEEV